MRFLIPALLLAACNTPDGPNTAEPVGGLQDISLVSFEACVVKGGAVMESYPLQCSLDGKHFTENIDTGKIGDKRTLYFEVGPQKSDCTGMMPMKCLNVNGQFFYDHIEGFTHKPGVTSVLEVEREQYCDPDVFNSCPQDVGIYNYRLVRVISEG